MIPSNYFWTNIFLLATGTILIRFSIIAASSKIRITDRHKQLFSFIPAAVLPALTLPLVYFHQGQIVWLAGKERLIILLVAIGLSYFIRSMVLTIFFGMFGLYLLSQF
jgi:branched-subunit amino acid transport protein